MWAHSIEWVQQLENEMARETAPAIWLVHLSPNHIQVVPHTEGNNSGRLGCELCTIHLDKAVELGCPDWIPQH